MEVNIIGAGPGGIYTAYELLSLNKKIKIRIFDKGNDLEKRICPISAGKVSSCIGCNPCSIMCGFGGAGAFSDGKFNITNDFGGTLSNKIGYETSLKLQTEVDEINKHIYSKVKNKNTYPPLFSSAEHSDLKKKMLENNLHLMDANIRHLGTDKNYIILPCR